MDSAVDLARLPGLLAECGLPAGEAGRIVAGALNDLPTVAALYVQPDGCYAGQPGVDHWPEARDARQYAGPWPVVAHPPCERWGRYWGGSPTTWPRKIKGDDGGCFAAALASVRQWGGVLEHPEGSHAWRAFGLNTPPRSGGWVRADALHGFEGWTCCVEQGAYGHDARKATWLYAVGCKLPSLAWGPAQGDFAPPFHLFPDNPEGRRKAVRCGRLTAISRWTGGRAATPLPFRELLLSIARTVHGYTDPSRGVARQTCVSRRRAAGGSPACCGCEPDSSLDLARAGATTLARVPFVCGGFCSDCTARSGLDTRNDGGAVRCEQRCGGRACTP